MKLILLRSFIIIQLVIFSIHLNAQDRIIHGIVTTYENVPLTGAKVMVKSTNQIVYTDTLGMFAVGCNKKDKLKVWANGFYNQNVKLDEKIKFAAVNLKIIPGKLDNTYNTGFGQVAEKSNTGSVGNLDDTKINFAQYNTIYDLIKGRIPGVQILNGDIIIRGENSINSSSAATIVVDGVTSDKYILNSISPAQVKNISVIKDGSAAIYGFKGSNGVLIIETKNAGNNLN